MKNGHHLDADFKKINELFLTYTKSLSNPQDTNLRLELRGKIIVEFWKALQKSSSVSKKMIEHSDLIVKKVDYCIKKCSTNFDYHDFAKYTFSSIKKTLISEANTNSFEEKSGMHISDFQNRKRQKIEKAYKQYMSFGKRSASQFIDYAVNYLGFKKDDLVEYINPKTTSSLFLTSSNDKNELLITDKMANPQTLRVEKEFQTKSELTTFLAKTNSLWKKQKESAKPLFSELLTRDILNKLSHNKLNLFATDKNEIKALFSKYEFLDKTMIQNYFLDINYKLPSQQNIANKYNLTKSAISKKLSRFYKN